MANIKLDPNIEAKIEFELTDRLEGLLQRIYETSQGLVPVSSEARAPSRSAGSNTVRVYRGSAQGSSGVRQAKEYTIGPGAYFTTNKQHATEYATLRQGGPGGKVEEFDLDASRILDLGEKNKLPPDIKSEWLGFLRKKAAKMPADDAKGKALWSQGLAIKALGEISKSGDEFNRYWIHGFQTEFAGMLGKKGFTGIAAIEGGEASMQGPGKNYVLFPGNEGLATPAPKAKHRRGSRNAKHKSGTLKKSGKYEILGGQEIQGRVIYTAPYAYYVEKGLGPGKREAANYLARALDAHADEIQNFLKDKG